MIKRTIEISNEPAYCHFRDRQLVVHYRKTNEEKTVPIEDIGIVLFSHPALSYSHQLLSALLENNVAVVFCDAKHQPAGTLLPMPGHTLVGERLRAQVTCGEPLKKRLWQDIITQKIRNQASVLNALHKDGKPIQLIAEKVGLGDARNAEARAAKEYWKRLFDEFSFRRNPDEADINMLLNYGYTAVRAAMGRALAVSGLHAGIGIHHQNQYNAFPLADDMMEPLRPMVDKRVFTIVQSEGIPDELNPALKKELLEVLTDDVLINDRSYPLFEAMQHYSASLARSFVENRRHLLLPAIS
jgi:CRISPR-associated protein Cas1